MAEAIGPRAGRVYAAIREKILGGELQPGAQLPANAELARSFQVALMTARQALARLEREGLVVSDHGRGTFVRGPGPAVLVVDDEAALRSLARAFIERSGRRVLEAGGPEQALHLLHSDPTIALVLTDVHMPTKAEGLAFIRTARSGWPNVPLAVLTGFPDDVAELHGEPEAPLLTLAKPIRRALLDELLQLVLGAPPPPTRQARARAAPARA